MTIKSNIATLAGRSSYWFLHNVLKGGTSFPGKLAMQIDPDVLQQLGRDYETIIVTGTNGKTMTTALITQTLREKYGDILTNPSGSNMAQGIVTAFLAHKSKKGSRKLAVLEVDEANVKRVTQLVHPAAFVLTNIFRDQMDRYGEIYTTYEKIVDGIKLAPDAKIIANGDASIFSSVDLPNPKVFFGFETSQDKPQNDLKAAVNTDGVLCPKCNHILHYHCISYANLGDFFCPSCGYERPKLAYKLEKISEQTPSRIRFTIEGQEFSVNIGGTYNIYNALAAFATASEFGVSASEIADAFAKNKRIFGRQELINYAGKQIEIILVKNPVGLNEVLSLLNTEQDHYTLAALLNAHHADGIDTSWIWDGNFESLNKEQIDQIIVGGERHKDMHLRLEVAGLDLDKMITEPDFDQLLTAFKQAPNDKIYILSTYTAMLHLRQVFADKGMLKRRIN